MSRRFAGAGQGRRGGRGDGFVAVSVEAAFIALAGPRATFVDYDAHALSGGAIGGTAPLTYAWTVVSKPVGSTVTFDDDTDPTSDVTLEGDNGEYVLRLTVTDDDSVVRSDVTTLTLNAPLAADAGADDTIVIDVATPLAGSATGGTEPYTHAWTVVSSPALSTVVFEDNTDPTSHVTLDTVGEYVLRLTVTDDATTVDADDVTLTVDP